jgi:hypothetical protein
VKQRAARGQLASQLVYNDKGQRLYLPPGEPVTIACGRCGKSIPERECAACSYKLALIRAIYDVVLSFPDAGSHDVSAAIPLRILAEYWVAYYWAFVDPRAPISQGPHSVRRGAPANDMAFRPALTALRRAWEDVIGGSARPSDGFFLINEFRVARRRAGYPASFRHAFAAAVSAIARSIEQPIHYAGPGEWGVFPRPMPYVALAAQATRDEIAASAVTPAPGGRRVHRRAGSTSSTPP